MRARKTPTTASRASKARSRFFIFDLQEKGTDAPQASAVPLESVANDDRRTAGPRLCARLNRVGDRGNQEQENPGQQK